MEILRLYRSKERCLGIRVAQEVAKGLSDEDSGGFWMIVGGLYKSQEKVNMGTIIWDPLPMLLEEHQQGKVCWTLGI